MDNLEPEEITRIETILDLFNYHDPRRRESMRTLLIAQATVAKATSDNEALSLTIQYVLMNLFGRFDDEQQVREFLSTCVDTHLKTRGPRRTLS